MGDLWRKKIRQPQTGDIVGNTIPLAALGTAFEAQYTWRLVQGGKEVDSGGLLAGSMGPMIAWVQEVQVQGGKAGKATFELSEEDMSGGEGNAPVPAKVEIIYIPGAMGYIPHEVRKGDTLTAICKEYSGTGGGKDVTTVANAALVNDLKNPDHIEVGQVLRIPV